jgi:hypothetical protein
MNDPFKMPASQDRAQGSDAANYLHTFSLKRQAHEKKRIEKYE